MSKAQPVDSAAFYARRGGRLADWWTLLHPPYTIWHLSYVVFGAALVPHVHWGILAATVLAFLLGMGVSAHALDELNGRPLRTAIPDPTLWAVAVAALVAATAIGVALVGFAGPVLVPFVVVGVVAVLAYNLEWFGGRLHTDWSFALSWGGLPALVGYVAQAPAFRASSAAGAVAVAGASVAVSYAQRRLSTPARLIRRRMQVVSGHAILADGTRCELDRPTLLAPLEQALRTMSVAVPVLAVGLLLGRVGLS